MRLSFLLLASVGCSSAQYDLFDLATSGDGRTAYFASTLSLARPGATSPAGAPGRIFRVGPQRFQLYLERPNIEEPSGTDGYVRPIRLTNYFNLSRPQVSQDGRVVAVVGMRSCTGASRCGTVATLQTTVTGLPIGSLAVPGGGSLSRNGRYLLIYQSGAIGGCSYVVDLYSGFLDRPAPCPANGSEPPNGRRIIADDGTGVVASGSLYIFRSSTVKMLRVSTAGSAHEPAIDAAGNQVVFTYYDWSAGRRYIRLVRLSDERQTTLVPSGEADSYSPNMSADGQRVLYISNASGLPQIYVVATTGGEPRQVSHNPDGVHSVTMSDDGKVAWYFSNSGRLFQLQLETGVDRERLGRTPQLGINAATAAGSYGTIAGVGLSDGTYVAQSLPLPRTLGGVTVTVNGIDSPLFSVSPNLIEYQVPLNALEPAWAEVRTPSHSPFVPKLTLVAGGSQPGRFLRNPVPAPDGGSSSYAVHEDWSGLVTPASPALPGEIVHLYGTNFGRVDSPPQDGYPALPNPLSRTRSDVTCWAWGADNQTRSVVHVHYAGLAPGLVGIYQLDAHVPLSNLRSRIQIACRGEGHTQDFTGNFAVKP